MKIEHTPGPWFANQISIYAKANCIINGGRFLAMCATDTPLARQTEHSVDAEALANARLMAAAPDLLAALQHVVRCIPMCGASQIHFGSATYEQMLSAIEKATGQC